MTSTPYGAWPSPISAEEVARGAVRLGGARLVGDEVWWSEGRPAEGGRQTIVRRTVDGTIRDLLPPPWNVRSRVHEYGGTAWLPLSVSGEYALIFVNFPDQRLYRLDSEAAEPQPLTPKPPQPASLRYADLVLSNDESEVWCVRESHMDGEVRRHIVAIPVDGSAAEDNSEVRELMGGSDFLANPRQSPDGRTLAWLAWDHPNMPWDGCELRIASVAEDGSVGQPTTLLGGQQESVYQPEWVSNEDLYVVTDQNGWWNLYRVNSRTKELTSLCPREEEFGSPLWTLGSSNYAILENGQLAVLHGTDEWRLGVLDPATGKLIDLDLPYTAWDRQLSSNKMAVTSVAGSSTTSSSVVLVDLEAGTHQRLRSSLESVPDVAYLPTAQSEVVPGVGGRDVHMHIYPPKNPDVEAPSAELPPYVVFIHGGPTSQSVAALNLEIAFFTSRGIGVVDVNYGGSTGYGRKYRELLRGQWGVVDVEDAVSAAKALIERRVADPKRIGIRGGSAGGYTVLVALTTTNVFTAGTSYYGLADLLPFVEITHDFESRYLDGLIGPLPATEALYVERSPLSHVDSVQCPILLLQGAEDEVVPPSQSEAFRDALARKGIPHAYLLFEGEQHGFRKAETKIASLEAELSFYGQTFGFTPPGVPHLPLS